MDQVPPLRILIIDDNEASAKSLSWMLNLVGHDIRLALDGKSGIEAAHEFKPQVVLLDIGLPVVNGYEVCEFMRRDPMFKDTLFIAQTGWGQQEHRDRSKEAGFDYHLVKPVQLKQLQEIFQTVHQRRNTATS